MTLLPCPILCHMNENTFKAITFVRGAKRTEVCLESISAKYLEYTLYQCTSQVRGHKLSNLRLIQIVINSLYHFYHYLSLRGFKCLQLNCLLSRSLSPRVGRQIVIIFLSG